MNLDRVRAVLHADRVWCVYALGDLAPERLRHAQWFVNDAGTGLVLLFSEFGTPILFAAGSPDELRDVFLRTKFPPEVYIHARPEMVPLIETRYGRVVTKRMLRMRFEGIKADVSIDGVEQLSIADATELGELYADGQVAGESPDFFFPQMLDDGTFFGIRKGNQLVAAAGTHILYEGESIGAVGNVYTHRRWRNQGLARRVTWAVVRHLRGRRIDTLALNVYHANPAAIRVYESLGFAVHCDFVEGEARELR